MAEKIRPFRGLLYSSDKVGGDISAVMAPPYDVIPENMRNELHEKNAYNVIRLILGKDLAGDGQNNNKYTRARRFLDDWQREGVLVRDKNDAFYVYSQEYDQNGQKCHRVGFMGLMKMGEPGKEDAVLPHEHTLAKPKEDRLNLIKQVESNLSPIFTLFADKDGCVRGLMKEAMAASEPVIDIQVDGERNRLWRFSDKEAIEKVISCMSDKKVFIADGHHRYAVARNYRDLARQRDGYNGSADHIMMYFADMSEGNDLTVMATHRVIKKMPNVTVGEIAVKLSEYFFVEECNDLSGTMNRLENSAGKAYNFGIFDGKTYLFIRPKDENDLRGLMRDRKTDEWKRLDVSALHSAIFDNILSVDNSEGNITYVREAEKGRDLVDDGSHMAAFFLNPTRVEQLKAVAEQGEMMPQKSTYFYPKLLTGLVIHRFEQARVEA